MHEGEDRVVGILLGLAAGDRIGGPARMALRLAESLRDKKGLDIDDIGARYLEWWQDGAFDTGPVAAGVLSRVEAGVPYEAASRDVDEALGGMTAGCNPAHRVAPLAACPQVGDSELDLAAAREARLTHRHPLAGEVAAVVARLCRALVSGTPWPQAVAACAEDRSQEVRSALAVRSVGELSRGDFAPEVLRAAVHFVESAESLPSALERAIDFAGPANYCPVLVGSLGGARWGRGQVDDAALAHQREIVPRLSAVALDLARAWREAEGRGHGA